jgi:hypothetical protein
VTSKIIIKGIEDQVIGTLGRYGQKKKLKGRNLTTDR